MSRSQLLPPTRAVPVPGCPLQIGTVQVLRREPTFDPTPRCLLKGGTIMHMHGLFDRLRIGREPPGPDPLKAAQDRIGELTEALQGLVDLSDSTRSRNIADVKRLLAQARRVLGNPSHAAPASNRSLENCN
jgi:hypothetical protein